MNNPLVKIYGKLSQLAKKHSGDIELREELEQISKDVFNISLKVKYFRQTISESEKNSISIEELCLINLIEGVIKIICGAKGIKPEQILISRPDEKDKTVEIFGDPTLLSVLFYELIINSIDFYEGESLVGLKINIEMKLVDNCYCIEYFDNSRHLEEEERIFNPFYTTKKNIVYNVGLGLTRAKKVLEAHRGSIKAKAMNSNKFSIKIPKDLNQL